MKKRKERVANIAIFFIRYTNEKKLQFYSDLGVG